MTNSISVILPTYNRAQFLTRSINSVLNQITDNDEFIIIDDGSTDNTENIVKKFGDKLRYIKTPNRGAGVARNLGIKEAVKTFVAFVDSDDEWMPGKINMQRAFMLARPDILFCFSDFAFWNKNGTEEPFSLKTWHHDIRNWVEILGNKQHFSSVCSLPDTIKDFYFYEGSLCVSALCSNYLNINTLLVRRAESGDALKCAEDTKTWEEWECLIRLSCSGKCAYFECETAWQHSHSNPRLTDATAIDVREAKILIFERILNEDSNFFRKHKSLLQSELKKHYLYMTGDYILAGRPNDAKTMMAKLDNYPIIYLILSNLPGKVSKQIALSLRAIRRITHSYRKGYN